MSIDAHVQSRYRGMFAPKNATWNLSQDQVCVKYLLARYVAKIIQVRSILLHSSCTQNVFMARKIIAIFGVKIEQKMRDVLAEMRDCRKEGKMRDFPND